MEVLYFVLFVQKRGRQDGTTATKKKPWRPFLPKFKLNLKEKRKVGMTLLSLSTGRNGTSFNMRTSSGNLKPQRRRRTISHQEVAILQDGEELYEAVGDDPAYLEVIRCD